MKKTLIAIVVAIIVVAAWRFATSVREGVHELWLMSAVKAPGRMALDSVAADLAAGRTNQAQAKLDVFLEMWREFESASGFMGQAIGNIMVEFSELDQQIQSETPNVNAGAYF